MKNEYTFNIPQEFVKQFKKDVANLAKVDSIIKMKIEEDRVMLYALAGDRKIFALKCFIYEKKELMGEYNDIILDYINVNSSNLSKSLAVMSDNDLKFVLEKYDEEKVATRLHISNDKIDLNFLGGRYLDIRDFSINDIESQFDIDLADHSFSINNEQFDEINKLARLNKEDAVKFRIRNGNIEFYDTRWNIKVGEVDEDDAEWMFDYKYLKSINKTDNLTFYMFNHHLIVKNDYETYLIALQLDI